MPQPAPPKGVDRTVLQDFLITTFGEDYARAWWKWAFVDTPDWGAQGWRRLDRARAACPPG